MEHIEYKRIVKGAKTALLFVHGILGTPNHFSELLPLVPESVSVYNILLDGHGGSVSDFSKTSMKKWENQIEEVVNELSLTHDMIYVAAHSLGTLLTIEQAIKNKKITKMFLLASPIKLFIKPVLFVNVLKVYIGKIKPNDKKALAAKKAYSITDDKNILKYIGWLPRFFELFEKIRYIRMLISNLEAKCYVYQSKNDEMVSLKAIKLLKQNKNISCTLLEKSAHYYYHEDDIEFLKREFNKFLMSERYIGKTVKVKIDRPKGSKPPCFHDTVYPINYGYIPGEIGGDGEELDVYLLGVDTPVEEYTARVIAVIHRENDNEDKLVADPLDMSFSESEIAEMVSFQEQYFKTYIETCSR